MSPRDRIVFCREKGEMRRKRKREDAPLIADGNSIRCTEGEARFPPPPHAHAHIRERGRR